MKLDHYIYIAMCEALKSNMFHQHGAIIIHRNKIIGRGHNYSFGKNKCRGNHWSDHAEYNAIKNCNCQHLLNESILIVVRITPFFVDMKNNNKPIDNLKTFLKDSIPCTNCQKTINKYKIKKIIYS